MISKSIELKGLTTKKANELLKKYGYNEIPEKKKSVIVKFLSHFWNPIAWMIEIAAILSFILGHMFDFYMILFLLALNGIIGFIEEYKADNIIESLKKRMAHKATVLRDGKWIEIDSKYLVPGDIIKVEIGNIVPADVEIIKSEYVLVDESSLTGESLPVSKKEGEILYSGSIIKKGVAIGKVKATGMNTYFGKTVQLVEGKGEESDLQKTVVKIGYYLSIFALVLIGVMVIVEIIRGKPPLEIIQFALILAVSAIPAAMPAVLTITLAIGAKILAKKNILVSKLASIEELASVDVLCTDKTGTLTKNKLEIKEIIPFNNFVDKDVLMFAYFASNDEKDPIDGLIINSVKKKKEKYNFEVLDFVPFDPVSKRTEAVIKFNEKIIKVSKGAPQVILELCNEKNKEKYYKLVNKLEEKGYRVILVALNENNTWKLVGLISIYDPPREDAKEAVDKIKNLNVDIKMVTGDHVSIAKTIAKMLGIGDKIYSIQELLKKYKGEKLYEKLEEANGFAEVFPEHKYEIVDGLQKKGHFVAMTGDGVNDAPALKKANCGIAVSNATDAARDAASIILLTPGISVIADAIKEARKIFQRMKSYVIYRITETIRILLFMTFSILLLGFYPLNTIMIILLAILNDISILTIAYDNVEELKYPARWELKHMVELSMLLGISGVISSFIVFVIALYLLHLPNDEIMSFVFLKLVLAGHTTILITRSEKEFWKKPYPSIELSLTILITCIIAIILAYYGILIHSVKLEYIILICIYVIIWTFVNDKIKLWYLKKIEKYHKEKLNEKYHKEKLNFD